METHIITNKEHEQLLSQIAVMREVLSEIKRHNHLGPCSCMCGHHLERALESLPTAALAYIKRVEKKDEALRIINADIRALNVDWFKDNGHDMCVVVIENIRKWCKSALNDGGEK